MVEPKFTQPPPALARLTAQPANAKALRRLRDDFEDATTLPAAELAAAAVNLVDRIADGSVAANATAMRLLGEAWAGLGDVEELHRLALVERLDACASGLGDDVPPETDDQRTPRAPEPPLLTTLADGSTVLPGTFDPASAQPTAAAASRQGVGAIDQLRAVATALEAASSRLAAQIGTLDLLAGEELRRLVGELSATSSTIDEQRRALADWVAANAAPSRNGNAAGDWH